MPQMAPSSATCQLCGRVVPRLTEHHLLPRSQGRRRGLSADQLPTAWLCSPCHKTLHRLFTNAELAQGYASLDALRAHEGVQRFVRWVRRQPGSKGVRVR